ncbi:serum paraoxonase/arylesterase 2-like [Dendropsophus ebraccatus]|uniref:serum paraoxonase/arylesterase 2-like n=1 Tax=Dendropsophus ebraccatus TaxID=150705 RepID=UPI0038320556
MGALRVITFLGTILNFYHRALIFNEVENIDLPGCQLLKGIEAGSEDIDVLPNGLAFISTGLKVAGMKSFAPDEPAKILLLDLEDGGLIPSPLSFSEGFDASSFNPHGLSTYIDETDGTVYLFVVNHPEGQTIVEIFRFVKGEKLLVHLKSVTHKLLTSVNDIVAVGPDSFYATIDLFFSSNFLNHMSILLGLRWTGVVYYSPGDVRQVVKGFHSANGITISTDKQYIYAADLTAHTINVFNKNEDWSLTPIKSVDVNTLVDNLSLDPVTGDIWLGGFPNLYKALLYNPEDPPGSEVIRIQNIHSDNPVITRVYANNGSVIQGSSCASVYKGQLLVGTIFHKALHCPLH